MTSTDPKLYVIEKVNIIQYVECEDFYEEKTNDKWYDIQTPVFVMDLYHTTVKDAKEKVGRIYQDIDPQVFEYKVFPAHIQ